MLEVLIIILPCSFYSVLIPHQHSGFLCVVSYFSYIPLIFSVLFILFYSNLSFCSCIFSVLKLLFIFHVTANSLFLSYKSCIFYFFDIFASLFLFIMRIIRNLSVNFLTIFFNFALGHHPD